MKKNYNASAVIQAILAKLAGSQDLTADEAADAMGAIMDGAATPAQIAAFATALRIKGETVDEIIGCSRAMRHRVVRVDTPSGIVLDTCGTGGDGKGTFNVSTVSAIVVAAAGIIVAKHGNRAASSRCGSADVLEALGVAIDLPKEKVEDLLRRVGMAFLFAPAFHPALRHAAPVRKELGFRTIFNILGPLNNPAFANVQTIGVFSPKLVRPFAEVLRGLGVRSAFVFHGNGLDELSLWGVNRVVRLHRGRLASVSITARSAGLKPVKDSHLQGGAPKENAEIARSVLRGEKTPYREAVLLNAGVALVAAGIARSLREGCAHAGRLIDDGAARRKLEALVEATRN